MNSTKADRKPMTSVVAHQRGRAAAAAERDYKNAPNSARAMELIARADRFRAEVDNACDRHPSHSRRIGAAFIAGAYGGPVPE